MTGRVTKAKMTRNAPHTTLFILTPMSHDSMHQASVERFDSPLIVIQTCRDCRGHIHRFGESKNDPRWL